MRNKFLLLSISLTLLACGDPLKADDDGDGVTFSDDCDDNDPSVGSVLDDADCDGAVTAEDCDDADSGSSIIAEDADCDGVLTADDCDDLDPNSHLDLDNDGYSICNGDCDDNDASLELVDADNDGYSTCDGDCDDSDATLELADADSDGYSTCDGDCDDSDSSLNLDDSDSDGYSTCDADCDDFDSSLNLDDSDGDGYSTCDADCDDSDSDVWTFSEVVIDFEDAVVTSSYDAVPKGYAGLTWGPDAYLVNSSAHPGTGYEYGTNGSYSMLNWFSRNITIAFPEPTDVDGAYFTNAWTANNTITVIGYLNGAELYSTVVSPNSTTSQAWFDLSFEGVDELLMTPSDYDNMGHFVVDDFTYFGCD